MSSLTGRARRNRKYTVQERAAFFEALGRAGRVAGAADEAGIASIIGYQWARKAGVDTTRFARERRENYRQLRALVVDHLSMSRIAAGLGVAWHTVNDAVLSEGHRRLINDPTRFDGVRVIGVDEHVWRHTRFGDKYVTVIIDLTPVANGTGVSRLLDMVPGRSKAVFKTWLAERPASWRENAEVVESATASPASRPPQPRNYLTRPP